MMNAHSNFGSRRKLCVLKSVWKAAAGLMLFLSATAFVPAAEVYHTDTELSSRDAGTKEAALGDLVADALRASAHTDAAFVPAAAFTDPAVNVPKPTFAMSDLLKALEYKGETIAIVKLTGDQIRAALEQSLRQYPSNNVGFLQTSGLKITFNPGAEGGKRLASVQVDGADVQGSKTYHIAMPSPLANGSQAYFKYWKKSDIEKDTGVTLEAALTGYLNDHKTITKGDDRLVAKSK